MMKIAVIGGSGFVGTRLIDLLPQNATINFDKEISKKYPHITKILDIRDRDNVIKHLNNFDIVILLAAELRDDVFPVQLYYDVNVTGTQNVIDAMKKNNIHRCIFTSSVAVYGLDKIDVTEDTDLDPFNDYGQSKYQAEVLLQKWFNEDFPNRYLAILRPTVIIGEENRGNVYTLLSQIVSKRFVMIGSGENIKSMAYVGNVASFINYLIYYERNGFSLFNYTDYPEFNMKTLVKKISEITNTRIPIFKVPYSIAIVIGYLLDFISLIFKIKFNIKAVRVKKFVANTQYNGKKAHSSGFKAPYSLEDGLLKTIKYEFPNK